MLIPFGKSVAATEGTVVSWGGNPPIAVPENLTGVVALAAGLIHDLALKTDGTVVAWGYDNYGQGTVPSDLSNVVAIAAGDYHSLALKTDGMVVAWGRNDYGAGEVPVNLNGVVAIAAGRYHNLALLGDGTVAGWGANSAGQSAVPSHVRDVVAIAAGGLHSLAAKQDGTVVAWGANSDGQTTVPANLSEVAQVAAGYAYSVALQRDGTVVAWGENTLGQTIVPPNLLAGAISAGDRHNLALRPDGTVVAWGYNYYGQSTVPPNLGRVTAVAAGYARSLAIVEYSAPSIFRQPTNQTALVGMTAILEVEANGTPPLRYQWRRNEAELHGQTNSVLTMTNLQTSDSGDYTVVVTNGFGSTTSEVARITVLAQPPVITEHPISQTVMPASQVTFSVGATGSAPLTYQWRKDGTDLSGQSAPTLTLSSVSISDAGAYSVVVSNEGGATISDVATLRLFGSVIAWGRNPYGEGIVPANLNDVVAIAAGGGHSLALKSDGTVVAWGANWAGQSTVPANLGRVIAIAAGSAHSLALRADGSVVGWGDTVNGIIATGIVAIAAGHQHNLALKTDRTVVAWGLDEFGQTVVPPYLGQVNAIAAGGAHNLALRADGTVVAWGRSDDGQTRVPSDLDEVIAISAGAWHSLALKEEGTVVRWGAGVDDYSASTNFGGVVSIAAGGSHNLVLTDEGKVIAWDYYGESTVPTNLSDVVAIAAGYSHSLALLGPVQPVGTPAVFADGLIVRSKKLYARGSATISLRTTFQNGTILFTVDGSEPDFAAKLYGGPFIVKRSATLRAIAYNAEFTHALQSDPIEIIILPTLTATTAGGGSVAVAPPAGAYFSNGTAVVEATASDGWRFLQWLGDITDTNPVVTIPMSRNRCIRAVFGTTLSNAVVGSGSVVRSPAAECYPYGHIVRMTAIPQPGNYFTFWGNAASSVSNPLRFTITNANPTVVAAFSSLSAGWSALTVVPNGFGQVSLAPQANRYTNGATVTHTAIPETGQSFLGWSGDMDGTNNPLRVTVNQSRVITANFTSRPGVAPILCDGASNLEEFRLLITGDFVTSYGIESTDFPLAPTWTRIATVTNSFGAVQFNDPSVTNLTSRFYRAVQP